MKAHVTNVLAWQSDPVAKPTDARVQNRSQFLQSATTTPWDRCFSGGLWLPLRGSLQIDGSSIAAGDTAVLPAQRALRLAAASEDLQVLEFTLGAPAPGVSSA